MLRIRLVKVGKKNTRNFRLVVISRRTPPKAGKAVEILGSYNPALKQKTLKKERILYWLAKGARPSDTAHNLLISEGVIQGKKIPVHKKAKKKEESVQKAAIPEPLTKT